MRLDLTDLQLFLHIVEAGSITAGAQRAHLALASASERVRSMEERLGLPLLLRGRRGVTPTPAGAALQHHARQVLQQMERLHGELDEYAQGLKGQVRLLCNTAALSEHLPPVLGRFLARHPEVAVEVEESLSYDILRALREGRAEVGIVSDAADRSGLECFPFQPDRLVAVAAPALARQLSGGRRRALPFAQLADHDFIGLAGDSALQRYLALQAARAGKTLRVRLRLRSFDAICRMVEQGLGTSVIPESAARRCTQGMAIRLLPLSDPWSMRQLMICVRSLAELPRHARQLVAELAQE